MHRILESYFVGLYVDYYKTELLIQKLFCRIKSIYISVITFPSLPVPKFFTLLGSLSGFIVIIDYLEDNYVNKVPTAILASGAMLLGFGLIGLGILLNSINTRFKELNRQINKIIKNYK